ncbi:MAG: hypothetical protein R3F55_00060 [Alphaproteobacteria bacterium]
MSGDHWFEPKPVGYGARPANWKGWAALLVFIAVVAVLAIVCFAAGVPTGTDVAVFVAGTLVATVALVVVARVKTRGAWRWRSRSADR